MMLKKINLLVGAICYFLAISLGHQTISHFYVSIFKYFDREKIEFYEKVIAFFIFLIILTFFAKKFSKNFNKNITRLWIFTIILTFFANKILISTNIELIHYFEYGILSFLLRFVIEDNFSVLWLATFAGIVDETYNYIFFPKYTKYLDFNDFILNFIGCLWGVVFFITFFKNKKVNYKFRKIVYAIFLSILIIFFAGFYTNRFIENFSTNSKLNVFPIINMKKHFVLSFGKTGRWDITSYGKKYYILSSNQGILIFLGLFIITYIFLRKDKYNEN